MAEGIRVLPDLSMVHSHSICKSSFSLVPQLQYTYSKDWKKKETPEWALKIYTAVIVTSYESAKLKYQLSLGSLNNEVFERRASTGSDLFTILGSDFEKKKDF